MSETKERGGVATLFGLPYRPTAAGADYGVLGVPWDADEPGRPGCRFGPRAIRNAYGAQRLAYEQDDAYQTDNLTGVDLGDLEMVPGYAGESMERVYRSVRQMLEDGAVPMVLGGSRLLEGPVLRACRDALGGAAVLAFSAGADGPAACGRGVQVGLRGAAADPARITARALRRMGPAACARRIRERIGAAGTLVALDIGVLDPVYAPGVGSPVPGGCTVCELCELLRETLPGLRPVGFTLTGVSAAGDPAGITALHAVAILKQFCIQLSRRKAAEERRRRDG